MPQTIDQSITTAGVAEFKRRCAMSAARHAVWVLGRTDAQLTSDFPDVAPNITRSRAGGLLGSLHRADRRDQFAWIVASYPNLDPEDLASIESHVQQAFAALCRQQAVTS